MTQIRELEPVLCHEGRTSQLIWTSSSNAHRSAFNIEDMQHRRGTQPYSSSKYATDLLSLALNTRYNKQVGSHTLFFFFFYLSWWLWSYFYLLLSRGCTHLSLVLVLWWPVWPMASCPPSQPSSGLCLCLSFGLWVHMWQWKLINETRKWLSLWREKEKQTGIMWSYLNLSLSLIISDKNVNQYFHLDPLQWSWSLGW